MGRVVESASELPAELVGMIRGARRVVALTGAGISAESGVPTFRDARTGLWARYDPASLATPEAFETDPALVWDWYAWRRELISGVEPNPGHRALAAWQDHARVTIVTQNVDGLHERAGSREIVELHGNIARTVCSRERCTVEDWTETERPPRCPRCGAPLRPDVVWFGEMLPAVALERALDEIPRADLLLSVGTSSLVQPAASLPFEAIARGVPVVELNPAGTPLTGEATYSLRGPAGAFLPHLAELAASGSRHEQEDGHGSC